jgi:hypothetical protein
VEVGATDRVEVILIITSVGSRIAGSGTLSTRTSRLPCHASAFIPYASLLSVPGDTYAGRSSAASQSWGLKPDT